MDPKRIPYSYSSLPPGRDSTRLLRLMPNKDETAVIKCQLFDYTLESGKQTHLYEALSYVWGDPNKTVPIFVGEHRFNITENLHTALLHLRNHSIERIIWVDAVCIDQANEQEKAHQIQYMAKIYGQANRVIIWLGEAADNSDQAFEDIRVAAEDEFTNPLIEETSQKAILKLLERLWFRRIWVLQEVAAARSVLIMCGSAEINGYLFCLGLNKLGLSSYSGLQGLVRSAIYLIRGAIFRPRYAMSFPSRVSLGELIDMYHNREATRRHDKIYALLGMSSEGHSAAGLSPDYQVSWKELLQRLVGFLFYKEISVEAWNEREIAVIKTKGFILGQVSLVESDSARYDRQRVTITFKNTSRLLEYRREWGDRWTLQASAKSIRNSDLVCLLQGALKPTIVRTHKDHFTVIVIAVTPRQDIQTGYRYAERQGSLPSMESFSRDFLLAWNWDDSNGTLAEINTLVSEYSMTAPNKITSLYNVALILQDAEEYEEAGKRLQEIEAYEELPTEEHLYTLACMEKPAFIYKKEEQWKNAEDLFLQVIQTRKRVQGMDHPDTLSSITNLASTYVDKGRLSAMAQHMMEGLLSRVKHNVQIPEEEMVLIVELFGKDMLTLFLVLKRDDVQITEEVLKTATGNWRYGHEVMALLLDRGGDNIQITEEVLKAAVGNSDRGCKVITLLLDRRGDDIQITEEVLKAAAGSQCGDRVMALLLDRRGDDIQITEEVLKAAIGNFDCGCKVITLLLDRGGNDIQITEEVLREVVGSPYGDEVTALLLDRGGDDIQITEEVLKAAVGNLDCGCKVITLLLDRRGDDIQITEEVLKAGAGNRIYGDEVMALLLDRRGDDIQITEEVLKAGAGNQRYGAEVMAVLLDRRGDDIQITEEVLKAAAGNWHYGDKVMALLVDRRGDDIQITEEVLKAAAGNRHYGDEVMALLLNRKGDDIHITEEVLKAAVGHQYGDKVMALLLDRRGDDIQITEKVLKAAVGHQYGDKVIALLLNRRGDDIQITEEVLKAVVGSPYGDKVVPLLLDRRGDGIQITEGVLKAAVGCPYGDEVIALLLDRRGDIN